MKQHKKNENVKMNEKLRQHDMWISIIKWIKIHYLFRYAKNIVEAYVIAKKEAHGAPEP